MDLAAFNQLLINNLYNKIQIRWGITGGIAMMYLIKMMFAPSHAIVAYVCGIYLLHSFILFATPKNVEIDEIDGNDFTPGNISTEYNEFSFFVRNMPEYEFWIFCTKFITGAFLLTFFEFTDIPCFTPMLIVYFLFMVIATVTKVLKISYNFNYNIFDSIKNIHKD